MYRKSSSQSGRVISTVHWPRIMQIEVVLKRGLRGAESPDSGVKLDESRDEVHVKSAFASRSDKACPMDKFLM